MSKTNDGGRAFPERSTEGYDLGGMKLRDWLAGQALALCSDDLRRYEAATGETTPGPKRLHGLAVAAYMLADAMLAARDV